MRFDRYHNGHDFADDHTLEGAGTFTTDWYWDETPAYETYLTVTDWTEAGIDTQSGPF